MPVVLTAGHTDTRLRLNKIPQHWHWNTSQPQSPLTLTPLSKLENGKFPLLEKSRSHKFFFFYLITLLNTAILFCPLTQTLLWPRFYSIWQLASSSSCVCPSTNPTLELEPRLVKSIYL